TFNGALFGMITILLDMYCFTNMGEFEYFALVSLMIIPVMYAAVICKYPEVSYFSCVVFLSITVNHIGDENPVLFVVNRILDTVIGIVVATIVNNICIPKKKAKDILFITGLDETLLSKDEKMTPYSKVELNRMIEKGLQFTIATERTLASLIEGNKGIDLKLPVIVFHGAVLYDLKDKKYLAVKEMEKEVVEEIQEITKSRNLCCFTTGLVQETAVIFYEKFYHDIEEKIHKKLRISPYRNYYKGDMLEGTKPFYLMIIGKNEEISSLYHQLKNNSVSNHIRMVRMQSNDYPSYVYLKIYHRECAKQDMIETLKSHIGIEKVLTIGTIPAQYDIVLKDDDENKAVKMVKKNFESYIWERDVY
ncbi:MAG: HAD hydrolase family protein, partial [Eubacteriales bacterium]